MAQELDATESLLLHLYSQDLHPDRAETDVARLIAAICGVQAQDANAAALQIRARTTGLTAADVDRAQVEDRSIVRTWAMRGTLHLVSSADVGWLLGLLGPEFIRKNQRRFNELGLTEDIRSRSLEVIRDALSRGPLPRPALAERLAGQGIPTKGQAIAGLVYYAGLNGLICFGPDKGSKPTYVLLEDWANTGDALPRESALGELARRYVAAYGPAAPGDFAAWSGLPTRDCRIAFESIAEALRELECDGAALWMLESHAGWLDQFIEGPPVVRLLGAFDTYLLGYASRDLIADPKHRQRINAGGGMIRPTLLVDGQVIATWKMERARNGTTILLQPFDKIGEDILTALEQEVQDIARFLETRILFSVAG